MAIDFGLAASDYAEHRAGFPDSFFERVAAFGIGTPGQRVADVGTGTGTLARGFARLGCQTIGIDRSTALLAQARELAQAEGVAVDFRVATAEETGLEPSSVDVLCAGQCWHWFDRVRAAAEAARVLAREGRLLIAHFDWLPLAGSAVEATEALILEHNPQWAYGGGIGVHPWWLPELGAAGYRDLETFSFDVEVTYSHAAWRGRIRASAGVGASLAPERVEVFDCAHAELLRERFPADPLSIPHRVFAIVARPPQTA